MRRAAVLGAVIGTLLVFAACSSSDPPRVDPTGSCDELASRCHPYGKTSIGHECHELGHAGDDKACAPRKAECLAACPPVEGGTSRPTADASDDGDVAPDSAADDAGQDSGDLCTPYCECLTDTCASQTGYPFTSTADCVAKCPLQSAEEKACFPKWCEKAKTGSNKGHVCEHAWGMHGLDECETL